MKKIFVFLCLALLGLSAGAQDLSCTFTQKKTLKAVHKVIPGSGTVTFTAPDQLTMMYDEPQGEYLIIDGNQLKNAVKGKAITVDTSKNAYMRNLRNTLLNCI
ncbi:MAG: outer-membrane lipoprotein carrier protein LolA, partial [Bacteroidales bacterium]|nr:outer-membrane lipoprotein carrier protein LolA [Bacteroidales bacterium]